MPPSTAIQIATPVGCVSAVADTANESDHAKRARRHLQGCTFPWAETHSSVLAIPSPSGAVQEFSVRGKVRLSSYLGAKRATPHCGSGGLPQLAWFLFGASLAVTVPLLTVVLEILIWCVTGLSTRVTDEATTGLLSKRSTMCNGWRMPAYPTGKFVRCLVRTSITAKCSGRSSETQPIKRDGHSTTTWELASASFRAARVSFEHG